VLVRGTAGADRLFGGGANDTLAGGLGKDVLDGGLGQDVFLFDTRPSKTNVDRIAGYSVADDTIHLSKSVFTKIAKKGVLASSAFWTGTKAHDASDRIIYNKNTGALYYDADGTGSTKAVHFATLDKNLKLTAADFFVI
jgi:Ca2+-binding RTX toxin-like protein